MTSRFFYSLTFLIFSVVSIFAQFNETQIVYLSGTGSDNTKDWDFYCTAGRKSGAWKTIPVPSCWEQHGFGSYEYGHIRLDSRVNEEGIYKHRFRVDKNWQNKNVNIVFDGVMTDCEVKINGKLAGEVHQGAFYQFKYDISGLLSYGGENQLEVHVKKHSENMSVNQAERKADYWVFGGIFRPVYLEIKPSEHIERFEVDARADGSFYSKVYISDVVNASWISVSIIGKGGAQEASFKEKIDSEKRKIAVKGVMSNPELWSPEFPNLYTAQFQLLDNQENVIHQLSEKIGFRTVEVREQDGIYVNDVRIKFKGVNRHTFHPDYARTSSKTLSIQDVNLIKDMNMNAVRMAHYPPEKHFLDACDSLGLFVLNELAGWQKPSYDSIVGRKLLKEMIIHDMNHPCIVFWDNANEGGWNLAYDRDFKEIDIQKREVIHPWAVFEKTNTAHYINYDYLSMDNFAHREIFFPTEFLHGLYDGGHGAGLEDYWQRMWHYPLCAGGFLWSYADECIMRSDKKILDCDGNHAPDGILGPYLEKEGSFYAIKEIWSPVYFEKRYITSEFNGTFNIENRYHYTNFNQCQFRYKWIKLSSPHDKNDQQIVARGISKIDNLEPGQKGTLKVDLVENWKEANVLTIEIIDPHGRLINQKTWTVKPPDKVASGLIDYTPNGKLKAKETNEKVVVSASEITVEISKGDGTLLLVKNKEGIIPLTGGPFIKSNPVSCPKFDYFKKDNRYIVDFLCKENRMSIRWEIHANGLVDLKVTYNKPREINNYAGISFNYPEENITGVQYMGYGPYRVWKNRMAGTRFGVWNKSYNNTITGHSGYEYPEFKGYYANFYWVKFQNSNNPDFIVYCKDEDVFLRLFTPKEAPEPKNTTVMHPPGDISFLHGIPPIGTKFKKADQLGPQSRNYQYASKRVANGALAVSLTFDFRVNSPFSE